MAEVVGLVSGIASLVAMAVKITGLSCSYIADTRSAHSTQKQYLREVNLLTEVLLRIEGVSQNIAKDNVAINRPNDLSSTVLAECAQKLEKLCSELQKPSPSIFWPIHERTLKKHIDDIHRFRDIFANFLSAQALTVAIATHRNVTRLTNHQDQTDLLEWLGNPKETSSPVPSPLPDTGAWFLNSECYTQWIARSKPPVLWCHGPPGVGKSMLAAVAIEDLNARSGSIHILHYFFDFGNRKEQTKETIWKDLLRQVIATGDAPTIEKLVSFRKELGLNRPASSKDFSDALKIVCADQKFVLVLDGPDEMEIPRELKIILVPFIHANCSVLVTSRDTSEIRSALNQATAMEVQADTNDLRAYIASRFEECDWDDLIEDCPEIEKEILEKSQGIFLLVRLLVDHLVDLVNVKEMRKALLAYPTHLEEAFESSLQRINAQSKSRSNLAKRVMGWIISAERKLQMSELAHGLATEEETDVIDKENLVSSKVIFKVCGGLVVIQGSAVGMVHTTVHMWLRNRYDGLYHKDLAESCLRYLTMSSFLSGVVQTVEEMDTRLSVFPFFSYAAQNWRTHLGTAEDTTAWKSIDRLLDNSGLRSAAFQGSHYSNSFKCTVIRRAVFETIPHGHSALHIASYWNLPVTVKKLLSKGEEKDARDTELWTPLHWACFAQSQEVVEILVSHGADTNAKDSAGWTPLFWAVLNGDTSTLKLLLQHGARYIEGDINDWTAVRWAVASLQIDAAKILLEHHINTLPQSNVNCRTIKHLSFDEACAHIASYSQDTKRGLVGELEGTLTGCNEYAKEYDELLNLAISQERSFGIARLSTIEHFDPPAGNAWRTRRKFRPFGPSKAQYTCGEAYSDRKMAKSWKSRMLRSAIRDGKLLAVRLLLETGAEVNRPEFNDKTQTLMHAATFNKDVRFAEILMQYGAHIETQNHCGFTPLQQAVVNGNEEVTRFLLSKGANANFLNYTSIGAKTALMSACDLSSNKGDVSLPVRMVRLLLEYGADPNIEEANRDCKISTFHYAVRARNPEILKLLFEAGINLGIVNEGPVELLEILLHNKYTDPKALFDSKRNCTPGPRTECLNMLVQNCGRDFLNPKSDSWSTKGIYTPLAFAAVCGDWEIFQALHTLGAEFETNAPLGEILDGALRELQLPAVQVLLKNGAVVSSSGGKPGSSATPNEWIQHMCLFSRRDGTTSDEVIHFRETMELLISHGFDIDATGRDGNTLLNHAVRRGSHELVACLLDVGANPYREDAVGVDSFLLGCLSRNLPTLKHLLSYNGKHTGSVLGHWKQHVDLPEALGGGDLLAEVCKGLRSSGQINMRCGAGTLLSEAASLDHWALVEELLVCGADLDDETKLQMLHSAAGKGQISVAKLLMDAGADVGILGGNEHQATLHLAARNGHISIVKLLIDFGADVDISDQRGNTPLHVAAKGGHTSVVKLLIDAGASCDIPDDEQHTPLHIAAREGHHGLVDILLSSGAVPDAPDCHGWTSLHFAALDGRIKIARSLLQAGASAGAATSRFAARQGRDNNMSRHWYPVGAWTGTPLHLAAMAGSADMTQLILQENVDVNARTDEGFKRCLMPESGPTALHIALGTRKQHIFDDEDYALDKERLKVASMLIERGASVDGVANHLRLIHIEKFKGFSQLWDKLRVGITVVDKKEVNDEE